MSSSFVSSPIFNNWFDLNRPNQSLLICSPYLKNYSLEKIMDRYNLSTLHDLQLEVLIRGKLEDFIRGSSDISALESLIRLQGMDINKIRRLTNLHMKAYLIDNEKLLIGSSNFTRNGLFFSNGAGNIEGAICTTDTVAINDFRGYYDSIVTSSEPLDVFYDSIVQDYEIYFDKISDTINNAILSTISRHESRARHILIPNKHRDDRQSRESESENEIIMSENNIFEVTIESIPQYSNFENGTYKILEILGNNDDLGLTFIELGRLLEGGNKSNVAYRKYGENHAKLAELLDLVAITKTTPRLVFLTRLGRNFLESDNNRKVDILKSQIFRMSITKDIINKHILDGFNLISYLRMFLSLETTKRRKPNVKYLFKFLIDNGETELQSIYDRL